MKNIINCCKKKKNPSINISSMDICCKNELDLIDLKSDNNHEKKSKLYEY